MLQSEQWLELHRLCLDTVRVALAGISKDHLFEEVNPMGTCIGEEVAHLISTEAYWLREVKIEPRFSSPPPGKWSHASFEGALARIQMQYEEILAGKAPSRDVLFGLGRVCQHALYHHVRIKKMRSVLQPTWTAPGPYKVGSWERAADYLSDLLIAGEHAKPMSD